MTLKFPTLEVTDETQKFWDELAESNLFIKRCGDCDKLHYFPRAHCPHCLSANTHWEKTSGSGTIYSLSTMRRGPDAPYTLAYVTLDEGPSLLTNILADDPDTLAIGQRVRLQCSPTEGGPLVPTFVPDAER